MSNMQVGDLITAPPFYKGQVISVTDTKGNLRCKVIVVGFDHALRQLEYRPNIWLRRLYWNVRRYFS